ncbi:sensor histidine kinase [Nocardioides nitrophenolicus]|uniref:sensor histidine kinase n=1 Tax=Nocardioides nitrophenolicus TaxID=60489 RepID=UPI00195E6F19|nr:histidine kinase [Nocardioides nitrophenolicus]MBM7518917.1 signal transduction histidine kinase [Nocardioides nitrophenolicus]
MPAVGPALRARLGAYFAVDDDWDRGNPPVARRDVVNGAAVEVAGVVTLELARSAGAFQEVDAPWWVIYLVMSAAALALVLRRRFPLAVAVYLSAHMFVTGIAMPQVMGQIALQICYFLGLFSAMAWGRSRRSALLVSGTILAFMLCWVAWQFAMGQSVQSWLDTAGADERFGFLPPVPAIVLLTFIINVVYFVGAIVGGQVAWRSARQRAALAEQARTIARQTVTLQERAVMDERLRIARELHDVVGHHVSVIGVQAAGARRVLHQDPPAAAGALGAIETSARETIAQMRSLLGTLRDLEGRREDPSAGRTRAATPGVADLEELVASRASDRLRTSYVVVEDRSGAAARVPETVGLTLYRTTQEALANVVRHSTATSTSVRLRVAEDAERPFVEVEVLDDGRPRPGTSSTGMGHLGIRERVASHRGEVEIGPRATRGYRVRARLPLDGADE